jgi:hypothetical protein
MKKFAIRTLSFLSFFILFSLVVNSIYLGIIVTTDWDFKKRIESMKFKNADYDLLVLGSSIAQYGIDTELLTLKGIKSYNLALVGSSVKTYYIQLSEYLTKCSKKPDYIILASNAFLEEFDQVGIHPVVEFTMKNQIIDFKDVPISKFRWQGTDLLKKALSGEYRKGYLSYGQVRRSKIVPDTSEATDLYLNIEKYRSAEWIQKLAELCHRNVMEFLIVEMPCVKETQNLSATGPYSIIFKNGYYATLYNLNSKDFGTFIDPAHDWVGMSHFNANGAARFTEQLYKVVLKGY